MQGATDGGRNLNGSPAAPALELSVLNTGYFIIAEQGERQSRKLQQPFQQQTFLSEKCTQPFWWGKNGSLLIVSST